MSERPLSEAERREVQRYMEAFNSTSITLRDTVTALVRRLGDAEARLRWNEENPGATHYPGCEQEHRRCALAKLDEARRLIRVWYDGYTAPSDANGECPAFDEAEKALCAYVEVDDGR